MAGLLAFAIPQNDNASSDELEILWEQKIPSSSRMDLIPLPDGDVLVSHQNALSAFSNQGKLLWEESQDGYLETWALAEDWVVFTTSDDQGPLMTADSTGVNIWEDGISGIPLVAGNQAWLYAEDGLYKLDLATRTMQRTFSLPTAQLSRSTAYALSDDGLILLHTDSADRRLLLFNSDGGLEREFSIPLKGNPLLLEQGGEIYLVIQPAFAAGGTYNAVEIFAIDSEQEILTRIFEGGSRAFNPRTTWVSTVNDQGFLIHLGGTGSLYFDPEVASKRMN